LHSNSAYEFQVCASTSKGKGEKAIARGSTLETGATIPEKPTFGMIGSINSDNFFFFN
jgi:hypothetical protein